MHKVLIVDDHESMSDSLSHALTNTDLFTVVGCLKSAEHAELYCMKLRPDLVLMDVCTEWGASGIEATKTIRGKYPDIKVIVMSGFDEITYGPRAKEAGAQAFVFKSKSLDYFVTGRHRRAHAPIPYRAAPEIRSTSLWKTGWRPRIPYAPG